MSHRAVVPMMPMRARARHLAADRGDVGHEGVELGLHPAGPADDGLALVGERAGAAVDEDDAQLPLEAGHVGRDVRLHRVQGPGGGREPAVLGDRHEGRQLPQVHRSIANMMSPIGANCWTDRARDCLLDHTTPSERIPPPPLEPVGETGSPPAALSA